MVFVFTIGLLIALASCGGKPVIGKTDVTISPSASPSTAQPGSDASIVFSGLGTSGTPASATVHFQPAGGGAITDAPVSSIVSKGNDSYQLTFTVPATLTVTTTSDFHITASGTTTTGHTFSSSNYATITLQPPAKIVSITPTAAEVGSTVDVTITASGSHFVQGTTQASFGAGTSVNGGADGVLSPITVNSATSAVARVKINAAAGTGARDVTVSTGNERATLSGAFTIKAVNLPPVVSIGGPYSGTAGQSVQFDASGTTDPDGGSNATLTYSWNFGDNSAGTGARPTHTYANAGIYTVRLTVTDAGGASANANATVNIVAPNHPPIVAVNGPYNGSVGQGISFSSAGTVDSDGDTLTYAWDFGDSSTSNLANPTHTYNVAGTFNVSLTVTDGRGGSATARTTATVVAVNHPPVANAGGPYSGQTNTPIAFDASGSSDSDGDTLTYSWNFGDGQSGSGVQATHSYSASGSFTVTLAVNDGKGGTANATATVTITHPPSAPVANVGGPYSGLVGAVLTFNGTGSTDPQGQTLTYAWSFGDGSTSTAAIATHSYSAAGAYTVSLTVTNTSNLSNTATTTATIARPNIAPVANAGGPYSGQTGTAINFDASASTDADNDPLTYSWNFGDGSTGSGVKPTHAYATAGTFTATVTVDDGHGGTNTASATVTVTNPPKPPVAILGGPYNGTTGVAINFDGSASSDPQGQTLTYAWDFGDSTSANTAVAPHTFAVAGTYTVKLTVANTSNLSNTASTSVTVVRANTPPLANAGGPYSGQPGVAINFDASASTDADNDPLTYSWNFGDGSTGTGAKPSHAYANSGTFSASVTVDDGHGGTNTASATVTIIAPPKAPVASIGGPYSGTTGIAINFDGSASSDPQGQTLTYAWDFGDSTTAATAIAPHTYTTAGTYTVTLKVTNTSNLSNTATTSVTVVRANTAPVANAGGPYSGQTSAAITFDASASTDAENDPLTYSWNFGDGSTGTGVKPTHAYAAAGTFTASVTVDDGHGGTNSASATVTVTNPPKPPVANIGGPYSGTTGIAISFDGSASSDPQGQTLSYAWDFGDSTTANTAIASHTYTTAGTYTVTLTVTNTSNLTNTATTSVTVIKANTPPVANPGAAVRGNVNQVLSFNGASSSDADGDTMTYAWDFGDGGSSTEIAPTHTYTQAGTFTVTLTVNDGKASGSATTTATITRPPDVTISSPAGGALFSVATTDVTGTVDPANSTVVVNGVTAIVSGGNFTATNVPLREGVSLITATATDANGNAGSASVTVNVDMTAPIIRIDSPANGSVVTSPQVTVTGMINDIVTGTVNAEQVTITVNGVPATVDNRSFSVSGILLVRGTNVITAKATDRAGNTSQASSTVTLADTSTQQRIVMVSGDNQTDVIGATLAQPVVVQLQDANGAPVANRPVTFSVTRSDGAIKALPEEGQSLTVVSDATGRASVLFQLGTRTGVGINAVTATSPGFVGEVTFSATSTLGTPDHIAVVRGEFQRGIIGQTVPEALEVIVVDRGGNPLPNVPITFKVEQGGGTVDETTTIVHNTNTDGKASAVLKLGQQEGINNNVVSANFDGNPGNGVVFSASGYSAGDPNSTSVSGVVMDNSNQPIPNVTIKLMGTSLSTVTNDQGQFKLIGAPVGTVTLSVDGSTSSRPETFPFLSFLIRSLPGQDNTLGMPIYLPVIDTEYSQIVGGDQDVVLTMRGVPGLAFTVPAHSVTFPDGSHVGRLSISQVKADMVPMAPPNGASPQVVWTLQPAGAKFNPPVKVQLPNTQGLAPGQVVEVFQFDHDLEQFVSGGTARVSADGSVIVTDPGFGISKAGWGSSAPPPPPKGCSASCDDGNECTADSTTKDPCGCVHNPTNDFGKCGGAATGEGSCREAGQCLGGHCSGDSKPDGQSCDDGQFCTKNDTCSGGVCKGTPPVQLPPAIIQYGLNLSKVIEPLKEAVESITAGKFELAVKLEGEQKTEIQCCEQKQMDAVQTLSAKTQATIAFESPMLPTPWSVPYPGGFAGIYFKMGASLGYALTHTNDLCQDNDCWGGTVSLGGGGEVGAGATSSVLNVSIGGSVGVISENSVNCKGLEYKVGIGEIKARVVVENDFATFFSTEWAVPGFPKVVAEGDYQFAQ